MLVRGLYTSLYGKCTCVISYKKRSCTRKKWCRNRVSKTNSLPRCQQSSHLRFRFCKSSFSCSWLEKYFFCMHRISKKRWRFPSKSPISSFIQNSISDLNWFRLIFDALKSLRADYVDIFIRFQLVTNTWLTWLFRKIKDADKKNRDAEI